MQLLRSMACPLSAQYSPLNHLPFLCLRLRVTSNPTLVAHMVKHSGPPLFWSLQRYDDTTRLPAKTGRSLIYLNLFLGSRLYQRRLSRSTLHQKQKIYWDKTTTLSLSINLWTVWWSVKSLCLWKHPVDKTLLPKNHLKSLDICQCSCSHRLVPVFHLIVANLWSEIICSTLTRIEISLRTTSSVFGYFCLVLQIWWWRYRWKQMTHEGPFLYKIRLGSMRF